MTPPSPRGAHAPARTAVPPRDRSRRIRSILVGVLLTVAALLAPLSVASIWAKTTISDTSSFVATMAPLADNPVIARYLGEKGASKAVTELNIQPYLEQHLPFPVSLLAASLTDQLATQLSEQVAPSVFRSAPFKQHLDAQLEAVHTRFLTLMTTDPPASSADSALTVTFSLPLGQALDALDSVGIRSLDRFREALSKHHPLVTVTLVSAREFSWLHWFFYIPIRYGWLVIASDLVLAGAAIALSTKRRRALGVLGISLAVTCLAGRVVLVLGQHYASGHAPTTAQVVNVILSTLTARLRLELVVVAVVGAAGAVALWASGGAPGLESLRRRAQALGRPGSRRADGPAEASDAVADDGPDAEFPVGVSAP